MSIRKLHLPLTSADLATLRAGDSVLLNGIMLTARDGSHRRIVEALRKGEKLPFPLKGQAIYYTGPTPVRKGQVIGSAGPTTSTRMDSYTPMLLKAGVNCTIGKGKRSEDVRKAMRQHKAVYLAVVGGAGALIARTIKRARVIAYSDLGAEAVYELEVANMPAVVINDIYGNDLYAEGRSKYRKIQI